MIDNTNETRDDILDKDMIQPMIKLYTGLQSAAKDVADVIQLHIDGQVTKDYLKCAYERYLNIYEFISSFALTGLIPLGYFRNMFLQDIINLFNDDKFYEQIMDGYFPYLIEVQEKFILNGEE